MNLAACFTAASIFLAPVEHQSLMGDYNDYGHTTASIGMQCAPTRKVQLTVKVGTPYFSQDRHSYKGHSPDWEVGDVIGGFSVQIFPWR